MGLRLGKRGLVGPGAFPELDGENHVGPVGIGSHHGEGHALHVRGGAAVGKGNDGTPRTVE